MQISILILTHNRPELFKRCIESVFDNYKGDIEILVNNDSWDIEEIYHPEIPVKYFYKQSENLSDLYKHLFDKAEKEYIYFLEDDDIILPAVFNDYPFKIICGNYKPDSLDRTYLEYWSKDPRHYDTSPEHFQLGQVLFKKECLTDFPDGNDLENDFKLFKMLKGSYFKTGNLFFKQTRDGKDAISSRFNKDPRWPVKNW